MTETELRRALTAAATNAIATDSVLTTDVLSIAASRRNRRWSARPRLRLALFGAIALAVITAAGALAVASGTLPVQFNLIDPGPVNHAKRGAIDVRPGQTGDAAKGPAAGQPDEATPDPSAVAAKLAAAASAGEETPDPSAVAAKLAAASAAGTGENQGPKIGPQPVTTTLAEAEAAFGTHILVPTGSAPLAVFFESAASQGVATKPGAPAPRDTVSMKYSIPGSDVSVMEERDDSTTPLTVDVLNEGGPTLKTNGGLGRAAIETINGGSYVIGYAVDDTSIVWVIFKSTTGVDVTIHFEPAVARDAAVAFAMSLQ